MKLRSKLVMVFMLSLYIPIIVVGFASYKFAVRRIEKIVFSSTEKELGRLRENFENSLKAMENDFRLYTAMIKDEGELEDKLKSFSETLGEVMARIVVDEGRKMYKLERRLVADKYRTYRFDFNDRPLLKGDRIKPDVGGYSLRLEEEINFDGKRDRIYLFIKLGSLFKRTLLRFDTTGGRTACLKNNRGVVIYHTDPRMINTISHTASGISKKKDTIICAEPLEKMGLFIETTSSLSPYILPLRRAAFLSLIVLVLVFALTSLLVYSYIIRFTETIKSLVSQAGKIAEGKRMSGEILKRRDEIGELSRHLRDISERLYRNAQLGAFHKVTAILTHDLKNYVAQLSLLLKNLERHYEDPAFKEDAIFTMQKTIERMEGLIKRLKTGRFEERKEKGKVKTLIQELFKRFSRSAIKMEEEVDEGIEFPDIKKLERILVNLIKNSIEAIQGEGWIKVKAVRLEDGMKIEVEDNGPGIPEDIFKDITEPFVSKKADGLGLGLYEVRELVKDMGGKLHIESEKGKGTRVTIEFRNIENINS